MGVSSSQSRNVELPGLVTLDPGDRSESRAGCALAGRLDDAADEHALAERMLLDQRGGDVRVAGLGDIVPGGIAEEPEALGVKFQDSLGCGQWLCDHILFQNTRR